MITLTDGRGNSLGSLSEAQLQFLIDNLEEESAEDQDYYIDLPTLDFLEGRGADPELVRLLTAAIGEREHITIRWSRTA